MGHAKIAVHSKMEGTKKEEERCSENRKWQCQGGWKMKSR